MRAFSAVVFDAAKLAGDKFNTLIFFCRMILEFSLKRQK